MSDPLTPTPNGFSIADPLQLGPRLAPPAGMEAVVSESAQPCAGSATEQRLVAVLGGAARGLDFAAAELWLLDSGTRSLTRRANWDPSRTVKPARRPLAEAEADLAVLAGGAVVVQDAAEARPWGLHRSAAAAIAVPVSSATTIHGVLWLFDARARAIADETVELVEIIGGRLALEIEAEQAASERDHHPLGDAAAAACEAEPASLTAELPTEAPQQGALQLAGRTFDHGSVAMHDWHTLADGRVLATAASIVDSPGDPSESALVALQSARVAARTLAESSATAGDLLERVNRAVYEATMSGEGVSIAIALLDSPLEAQTTGQPLRGSYAAAGPAGALRVRVANTQAILPDATPLGWDQEAAYASRSFELATGERLVLIAGDVRLTSPLVERRLIDAYECLTAKGLQKLSAKACVARIAQAGCEAIDAAITLQRI
ncbi:GAF domain-containing protein [Botrimarina hoheduenensis]|uniref:Stage II sporulation protein E (SpoIIE) n=1 Tax=Botrimarina hoheduenensis TaxID=2528000 RepID=A0A5C5W6Q8_9BACT|nr:GAF domain-containing protein [Botrimarina hoheduenensis]TWT46566.1 hypothetical protein Pla111_16620 [Botrimarina hoheduenensis]